MKKWQKDHPPYEGDRPYLYLAFAEADSRKVWPVAAMLLARGCRIWYCCGPAGSADEVRCRQSRAAGADLTAVYLSDAACADTHTKSNILVNQQLAHPIICLDPDGADRRLTMGLREDVPHIPLYEQKDSAGLENAIIHAEGFSQEMIGEPVKVRRKSTLGRISTALLIASLLITAVTFAGARFLRTDEPEIKDEVVFSDEAIRSAVHEAAGGVITEERLSEITSIKMDSMPADWDELTLLPALEEIVISQDALLSGGELPEGYTIILQGGAS